MIAISAATPHDAGAQPSAPSASSAAEENRFLTKALGSDGQRTQNGPADATAIRADGTIPTIIRPNPLKNATADGAVDADAKFPHLRAKMPWAMRHTQVLPLTSFIACETEVGSIKVELGLNFPGTPGLRSRYRIRPNASDRATNPGGNIVSDAHTEAEPEADPLLLVLRQERLPSPKADLGTDGLNLRRVRSGMRRRTTQGGN